MKPSVFIYIIYITFEKVHEMAKQRAPMPFIGLEPFCDATKAVIRMATE